MNSICLVENGTVRRYIERPYEWNNCNVVVFITPEFLHNYFYSGRKITEGEYSFVRKVQQSRAKLGRKNIQNFPVSCLKMTKAT
jgi:hypothetical protein